MLEMLFIPDNNRALIHDFALRIGCGLSNFASIMHCTFMFVSISVGLFLLLPIFSNAIDWGTTFGGLSPSYITHYDCNFGSFKTCCAMFNYTGDVHEIKNGTHVPQLKDDPATSQECTVKKIYFPSKYELDNYAKAKEIALNPNEDQRRAMLSTFFVEDIPHSNRWLARVNKRMQYSEEEIVANEDDHAYLSKFQVTKTCPGPAASQPETWFEWIEPLSIHARHPFAYVGCVPGFEKHASEMDFKAQIQSPDFVLLQSGRALHNQTSIAHHGHHRMAPHRNHQAEHSATHTSTHNYFFDGGTSTFQSSLNWFLCAYLQVKTCKIILINSFKLNGEQYSINFVVWTCYCNMK